MPKLAKLKDGIANISKRLAAQSDGIDKRGLVENINRLSDVLEREKEINFDGFGKSLERLESAQGTDGGRTVFLIAALIGMVQELSNDVTGLPEKLEASIKEMKQALEDNTKPAPEPVSKPTEWTFTVNRDNQGFIENVSVKANGQKPQKAVDSPFAGVN